jgi:hypothetical protein
MLMDDPEQQRRLLEKCKTVVARLKEEPAPPTSLITAVESFGADLARKIAEREPRQPS